MALGDLVGRGWVVVDPPEPDDDEPVIARLNGEPIRRGLLIDRINESDNLVHRLYRSGQYDLEVKVDLEIGRGQVKVDRADGYD